MARMLGRIQYELLQQSMTRSDVLHDSNDAIQVLVDDIIGSTQIISWTVSIEECTLQAYKSISKISFKF